MNLITKLKQDDGQFEIIDFVKNESAYVRAIKTLLKNKNYQLLYKVLNCYYKGYRSYADYISMMYSPGQDFVISFYAMFLYARLMEKGIKGVVEQNKEESDYAYLQLLKRIERVPTYISSYLYKNKMSLLLKNAYPDAMDRYSVAFYYAGMHYYNLKDYKRAFRFFKKGAEFDNTGRQIAYPFYLVSKNQSMVADMYLKGLGVEKSEAKAIKYYKLSAGNCGKKEHQRMGDIYLNHKEYSKAFLAYTEINKNWPWKYSTYFMCPDRLDSKFKKIYKNLDKKKHRTNMDTIVLAMMLKMGLGCEKNIERAKELLPEEPEWVTKWVEIYVYTRL